MFEKKKEMSVLAEDDILVLMKIVPQDRADFLRLESENRVYSRALLDSELADLLWEEFVDEKAFYVTIRRKNDGAFLGFCGISNTEKEDKNLVIEILEAFHGLGYGYRAMKMFFETITENVGNSFVAKIDANNVSSRKLFEKLGAKPSGISEFFIHDEQYMEEYERDNRNEVTEEMREVARTFGVEPEKLLTHVLLYRFQN